MTFRQLIRRSLRFHARSHLGVLLGAAVSAAVLIGALAVGDSVKESLRARALERLAGASLALDSGDRFFTTNLFSYPGELGYLRLRGIAARQDGTARANHVQIFGGPPPNAPGVPATSPDGIVLNQPLARQLAAKTGDVIVVRIAKPSALSRDAVIAPKDETSVALRLTVENVLPEAVGNLSLETSQVPPLNAYVDYGRLSAAAGVPRRGNLLLRARVVGTRGFPADVALDLTDRFPAGPRSDRVRGTIQNWAQAAFGQDLPAAELLVTANATLRKAWQLADAELAVSAVQPSTAQPGADAAPPFVELSTRRIFLDPAAVIAALGLSERGIQPASATVVSKAPDNSTAPAASADSSSGIRHPSFPPPVPVLTYLVNALRTADQLTPYSMVTAAGPPYTPADLAEDEMLVNEWLAADLGVKAGDRVELTYYVLDSVAKLTERTNSFRVRDVVPLKGLHADRTLMPEFPGLAKAESTEQWDAGFDLVHKLRPKDEAYWKQWRGTPKAFISLKTGQQMWGNRFGELTAIRWFPANSAGSFQLPPSGQSARTADSRPDPVNQPEREQDAPGTLRDTIASNLLARLNPADFGLHFEPVRERALQAASSGQDFGGLFLGFSFFLIIAALLLTALLFQFSLEQRATEIGTLLAVGFAPARVRRLLLGEGFALSLLGTAVGAAGGIAYAKAVLWGLRTVWRDAVGSAGLEFHCSPATLLGGGAASVLVALVTIRVALRRQVKRPARELLAEGAVEQAARLEGGGARWPRWLAVGSTVAALGLVGAAFAGGRATDPGLFFGAGSLLLIAGLAATATALAWLRGRHTAALTLSSLGVRGATRRSRRSLATVALLACGSFLIVAVGANKLDAWRDATKRSSGTGGFALWGESALPVIQDLNTSKGRQFFGLDDQQLAGVSVVPMRVREGDDASCLNLNRAQRPRLLGVKPDLLAQRGAFTFTQLADGVTVTNGWLALNSELGTRNSELPEVPAIGDANSIQWALGKKIGDTLDYVDERGRPFRVRLVGAVANSILQGNLLIDEAEFVKRFPGESGYRAFLVDVSPQEAVGAGRQQDVAGTFSRALEDVGLELTPAFRRLAQFNAVQNTYLNTFQVLGGLGLLLGSIGLGVVVLRNVFERRAELAVMQAVGFERNGLHRLVLAEHGALLLLGLAVGVGSAVFAVLPALLSPGSDVPWRSLALTLLAVLVNGALWTWLATRRALGGRLLEALRAGG